MTELWTLEKTKEELDRMKNLYEQIPLENKRKASIYIKMLEIKVKLLENDFSSFFRLWGGMKLSPEDRMKLELLYKKSDKEDCKNFLLEYTSKPESEICLISTL